MHTVTPDLKWTDLAPKKGPTWPLFIRCQRQPLFLSKTLNASRKGLLKEKAV
jgi:hypothetical protein